MLRVARSCVWPFEAPLTPKLFVDRHSQMPASRGTTTGVGAYYRLSQHEDNDMAKFLLWCILLVICWPLALLAVIAYPFVWLLLLPFRIVGIAVGGVLELVSAIIFLPVRMVRAI